MQKETKKKRANSKKAISLIVLVITIIVMVILAGAVIVTLNNSGIITRANSAVRNTNTKTVEEMANVYWAEAYATGKRTQSELESYVREAFENAGIDIAKYDLTITTNGVEVELTTGLKINKETMKLLLNEEQTLKAVLAEIAGTPVWSNSNSAVASITGSGNEVTVKGLTEGTTTITVTVGSYTKTCEVTVTEKGIKLNKTEAELEVGGNVTITATLQEIEGEVTWSTSSSSVASLNTTSGNSVTVTGVAGGTAVITATVGTYSKTCTVTVIAPPPELVKDATSGKYTTIKYNGKTLGIGDTINYVATGTSYLGSWKIFGVNEFGELLIMAAESPEEVRLGEKDNATKCQSDWVNAKTLLDAACVKYGHGAGASSTPARSVTVEEINKLTGYNPLHTGVYDPDKTATTGSPYMNPGENVAYNGTKSYTSGTFYNGTSWVTASSTSPVTMAQTYYQYYPGSLTPSSSGAGGLNTSVAQEKKINDMIFKTLDGNSNASTYWLASPCVGLGSSEAYFDVRRVDSGIVCGKDLYYSRGSTYSLSFGVRPLVSLSSNIQLTEGTTTDWVIN